MQDVVAVAVEKLCPIVEEEVLTQSAAPSVTKGLKHTHSANPWVNLTSKNSLWCLQLKDVKPVKEARSDNMLKD